ncbi:MAG: hypothetical protein ABR543_14345 [Gemmatimonadaceae bacterium]
MIRRTRRLDELEANYEREAFSSLSYEAALQRFAAMWAEARALNPDIGADWLEDLESDFAVARALNGLPPLPPPAY